MIRVGQNQGMIQVPSPSIFPYILPQLLEDALLLSGSLYSGCTSVVRRADRSWSRDSYVVATTITRPQSYRALFVRIKNSVYVKTVNAKDQILQRVQDSANEICLTSRALEPRSDVFVLINVFFMDMEDISTICGNMCNN